MNFTNTQISLEYLYLMADGDEVMVKTMLEMLLAELPEELAEMHTCYEKGNWDELRQVSHKMKSTLSFVGHDEMSQANREIEIRTKEKKDLNYIGALLDVLDAHAPGVVLALQEKLSS